MFYVLFSLRRMTPPSPPFLRRGVLRVLSVKGVVDSLMRVIFSWNYLFFCIALVFSLRVLWSCARKVHNRLELYAIPWKKICLIQL